MAIRFEDIMMSRALEQSRRGMKPKALKSLQPPMSRPSPQGNRSYRAAASRRMGKTKTPAQSPRQSSSRPNPSPSGGPMQKPPDPDIQWFIRKLSPQVAALGKKNGRF